MEGKTSSQHVKFQTSGAPQASSSKHDSCQSRSLSSLSFTNLIPQAKTSNSASTRQSLSSCTVHCCVSEEILHEQRELRKLIEAWMENIECMLPKGIPNMHSDASHAKAPVQLPPPTELKTMMLEQAGAPNPALPDAHQIAWPAAGSSGPLTQADGSVSESSGSSCACDGEPSHPFEVIPFAKVHAGTEPLFQTAGCGNPSLAANKARKQPFFNTAKVQPVDDNDNVNDNHNGDEDTQQGLRDKLDPTLKNLDRRPQVGQTDIDKPDEAYQKTAVDAALLHRQTSEQVQGEVLSIVSNECGGTHQAAYKHQCTSSVPSEEAKEHESLDLVPDTGTSSRSESPKTKHKNKGILKNPPTPFQKRLSIVVHSKVFTSLCVIIIVTSIVCTAFDADAAVRVQLGAEDVRVSWLGFLNDSSPIFVILAFIELSMRIGADRKLYFIGPNWPWALFDCIVCACGLIGSVKQLTGSDFGFPLQISLIFRIFRVASLCREANMTGITQVFHHLRLMMVIIIQSLPKLMWSLVSLLIVMLVFGIVFLHGVEKELEGTPSSEIVGKLKQHYGSLPRMLMTLFMAVTGGEDWSIFALALMDIHAIYGLLFFFYIALITIGVLNVVTGVFVDSALQMAQRDRDVAVQESLDKQNQFMRELREIFIEADTDKSGTLSWQEFKTHAKDERVLAYLNSLELDGSQARGLFKLLDVNGDGDVDIDEFVSGCMRLKGTAKSIDVCTLLYEFRRLVRRLTIYTKHMQRQMDRVVHRTDAGSHELHPVDVMRKGQCNDRGLSDMDRDSKNEGLHDSENSDLSGESDSPAGSHTSDSAQVPRQPPSRGKTISLVLNRVGTFVFS